MTERAMTFGPSGGLVGVLSTPNAAPADDRPAVLMWNVGVHHRVGPFRANVELARALADAGFTSLRFDASGLGDSAVRREAVRDAEREPLDIADAMDAVTRRTRIERFIVVGYCSSVDAAHRIALDDQRVIGAVHIEGYAHRTLGFRRRALKNVLRAARWDRWIRRRIAAVGRRVTGARLAAAGEPVYTRTGVTSAEFRSDLNRLTTDLAKPHLFVYGSDSDVNHADQFWEMFGGEGTDRSLVDVRWFAGADHTFYDVRHRAAMVETVVGWACERFADRPAPAEERAP